MESVSFVITDHIKTLIYMYNGCVKDNLPSPLVVYRVWRYEPVLRLNKYKIQLLKTPTRSSQFNPFTLVSSTFDTDTIEVDCLELIGEQVVRKHDSELPGAEIFIVLTGLLYGIPLERIKQLSYTHIAQWYDMLCHQFILQPCPVIAANYLQLHSRVSNILTKQFVPKSVLYLPRFLNDHKAQIAVLAEQMGQLCRYYPPAHGLMAWAINSKELHHLFYILKLAKMTALTKVFGIIRKAQKRQLRTRIDSLINYRCRIHGDSNDGFDDFRINIIPSARSISLPQTIRTNIENAKWTVMSDLSFFTGNVALVLSKNKITPRIVDTSTNLSNLQSLTVTPNITMSINILKDASSLRTLSQVEVN